MFDSIVNFKLKNYIHGVLIYDENNQVLTKHDVLPDMDGTRLWTGSGPVSSEAA